MSISVCIITLNEEANLSRTLASVRWADEVVIVDSGSSDRTCEIAQEFGVKVYVEEWKGFSSQKNSALKKAASDWILSLDADEEVSEELGRAILHVTSTPGPELGYQLSRRNLFLGKWIKHGGFYPDRKLRLWRRGVGYFEQRPVHETARVDGAVGQLPGDLIHHAYPTLENYIEHMNRYSTLGAQAVLNSGEFSNHLWAFVQNVGLRPQLTFFYNYLIRLGFLDGREGLLLHLYHRSYVSWKYAKAWEQTRHLPPS